MPQSPADKTSQVEFDFVIVGSGGGGLVAALAAADAGLKPLVIEKQSYVGGSTAMSGGVIWMPNNPLMQEDGVADSYEQGLAYLQSVVGDPDEGSSIARREAFLKFGPQMLAFIRAAGVKLTRCEGYSDYYDNRDGGNARGRAVEGIPWDGKQLGEWHSRINPGLARGIGLAVMTNEGRDLPVWTRSYKSFRTTVRVVARTKISQLFGKDLLTNGMSLIGQLTQLGLAAGIPIWMNSPVHDLIIRDGTVVGVRATHNGQSVDACGRYGVLLSAGGFERNPEMRQKYSWQTQPNDGSWTLGSGGNTGEVLAAAIAAGAKTDYMDEAVWNPLPRAELAASTLMLARQYPCTVIVNKEGRRFCNESNSYVEVTKAMYKSDAIPAWLIFDDDYRRRFPWAFGLPKLGAFLSVLPGRLPSEWVSKRWIEKASSLDELAARIGVDPTALTETIRRFNGNAVHGQDPDFGRGESQYNRVLGDPRQKPNPALGPIQKAPFYATRLYPGDVGTAGGVITNEHAQVLNETGAPIPGLYATGNLTATVMGRTYPGAGASIANTTVFGYIAARHAAAHATRN